MATHWLKFLEAVSRAKAELNCSNFGAWYRGVGSAKYRLYPKLLRPRSSVGPKRERDIYYEYSDFSDASSESSWERLVRMQHYGVPTRLMDWTEVFGIALYFSMLGGGRSPSIWILNPFSMSRAARLGGNDTSIGRFHEDADHDYYDRFIKQGNWPYQLPFPYRSPKLNPRIRAQRGFFTVHGSDHRPLDSIHRRYLRQIRLPEAAYADAKAFLDHSGIDSLSMFPDHEGFARRLHEKYEP